MIVRTASVLPYLVALPGGAAAALTVRALLRRRSRPLPSPWVLVMTALVAFLAILGVGLTRALGADTAPSALLPALVALVLVWSTIVAATTDVLVRLVPDPLTLGTLAAVVVLLVAIALVGGDAGVVLVAVVVAAGAFAVLALPAVLLQVWTGRPALGGGDRKFVPVVLLGLAALAPSTPLLATAVASWSAGVHALTLVVRARRGWGPSGRTLPLAPHLAVGTLVAVLAG